MRSPNATGLETLTIGGDLILDAASTLNVEVGRSVVVVVR